MKRVLLIDDSPLVIEAVTDALDAEGIAVEGVSDVSALADLDLSAYALIVMDVQMPAMFGDDVAVVMRQRGSVTAPIVLLSSLAEEELAARVHDAGLDGYIHKQAGIDGVIAEVRAWLEGGRSRRAPEPRGPA